MHCDGLAQAVRDLLEAFKQQGHGVRFRHIIPSVSLA